MGAFSLKSRGFTLIEMVTVMVILGVLAVGISNFLQFGSRIYLETNDRSQLIASARFAIERLNREVRHALPNSPRLIGNNQCLEFRPIKAAAIYTEIPLAPLPASSTIKVIRFDDSQFSNALDLVIYPLTADDAYFPSDKMSAIDSSNPAFDVTLDEWPITLDVPMQFTESSPTNRVFFIDKPVSYCIEGLVLNRYENYTSYRSDGVPNASASLMAEHLDANNISSFQVNSPSQLRSGNVLVKLNFSRNDEVVSFNNEIQVPNVP
ncbi:PulJ/GspJ family protein [Thalassotalea profundi]|uniref:MSHA biogenesis protein MshO n=1 Tax=Thalassotalea profundi TaxID=2036687 RepID=A0ABQ3J2G2_9GAMM|nr:type II secretion system protein [Thalassotalea profundi]GHE99187.1 MSHA biogenesis protein MshO [Thalassotalea profundi]